MRSFMMMAALSCSPALAAPPLCTLPASIAISVADSEAEPLTIAAPHLPPDALASIPFVQHVSSAGALMTDLGEAHGIRAVAARSGDQFMLFEVTPDGQAAVSGAIVELTPTQLQTIANGNITDLSVEHGLPGFFVRSGPQFQVFYMTPDKERLIPGVMWDAAGKNITRKQIADLPGAVPTVVVGSGDKIGRPGSATDLVTALALLQKPFSGTIGPA